MSLHIHSHGSSPTIKRTKIEKIRNLKLFLAETILCFITGLIIGFILYIINV